MMDNNISFKKLYTTILLPELTALDQIRKKIIRLIKKYFIISLIPISISANISILLKNPLPIILIIILAVVFSFYKINPFWKNYYTKFKEEIIRKIIYFINKNLNYFPSDYLTLNRFKESTIFIFISSQLK